MIAAALVLTREPILSFGVRAYVDIPFVCLVLAALLRESRRPRDGVSVLVLLGLAGLIRPEAWLFAAVYLVYLWWPQRWTTPRLPLLIALAAAGPVLWALHDLLITGDPLYSLTGTRENADVLRRATGFDDLPITGSRRLGEIAREPVLLGAVLASGWRSRSRSAHTPRGPRRPRGPARRRRGVRAPRGRRPADHHALPPARSRPALALLAAVALTGFARLARDDRLRRPAYAAAVAVVHGPRRVRPRPARPDRPPARPRSRSRPPSSPTCAT